MLRRPKRALLCFRKPDAASIEEYRKAEIVVFDIQTASKWPDIIFRTRENGGPKVLLYLLPYHYRTALANVYAGEFYDYHRNLVWERQWQLRECVSGKPIVYYQGKLGVIDLPKALSAGYAESLVGLIAAHTKTKVDGLFLDNFWSPNLPSSFQRGWRLPYTAETWNESVCELARKLRSAFGEECLISNGHNECFSELNGTTLENWGSMHRPERILFEPRSFWENKKRFREPSTVIVNASRASYLEFSLATAILMDGHLSHDRGDHQELLQIPQLELGNPVSELKKLRRHVWYQIFGPKGERHVVIANFSDKRSERVYRWELGLGHKTFFPLSRVYQGRHRLILGPKSGGVFKKRGRFRCLVFGFRSAKRVAASERTR